MRPWTNSKVTSYLPSIVHLLAIFLIAGLAAQAPAEDDPVDYTEFSLEDLFEMDVVYGASKHEQKTADAPSSISIVTAEEIELFGYRTLGEVLASLRGFYMTDDRNYQYVGVRGFGRPGDYNSRLLVLVDGAPLNEGVYGGVGSDRTLQISVDNIQRMEIIRGPASCLYGTNALFGVINIVTKEGHEIDGVQIEGSLLSFGGKHGKLQAGGLTKSGVNWYVSGETGQIDGQDHYFPEFDYPEYNDGVFTKGDTEKWSNLLAKVSYQEFTLEGIYSQRKKWIPTAPWETNFDDNRSWTDDRTGMFIARYQKPINEDTDLTARVNYGFYDYEGEYAYWWDYDYINFDIGDSRWLASEISVSHTLDSGHVLDLGAEYRNDTRIFQKNYDQGYEFYVPEDEWGPYLDDVQSGTNWGVYGQAELHLRENWQLTGGLRHDDYSTFGSTTNPRFASVTEVADGTILKALYGQAFRAPSAYELYYHDGGNTTKANPHLGPENITTYELIWEQHLRPDLHSNVSLFHYENKDLVEEIFDDDDLLIFTNRGRIESTGVEAELEGRFTNGWRGRLSYSYQNTKDQELDQTLTNSPQQMVKLNVMAPLRRPTTRAGFELQYFSNRKTYYDTYAEGYLLANLTMINEGLYSGLKIRERSTTCWTPTTRIPAASNTGNNSSPRTGGPTV